jgi:hypothetical protein
MTSRLLAAAMPILLLAGCGGGSDSDKADKRTASGEVLEGTISDAMLPLETVKSQPPLLKVQPAEEQTNEEGAEGDGASDTPGDAPLIADEPAGAN